MEETQIQDISPPDAASSEVIQAKTEDAKEDPVLKKPKKTKRKTIKAEVIEQPKTSLLKEDKEIDWDNLSKDKVVKQMTEQEELEDLKIRSSLIQPDEALRSLLLLAEDVQIDLSKTRQEQQPGGFAKLCQCFAPKLRPDLAEQRLQVFALAQMKYQSNL